MNQPSVYDFSYGRYKHRAKKILSFKDHALVMRFHRLFKNSIALWKDGIFYVLRPYLVMRFHRLFKSHCFVEKWNPLRSYQYGIFLHEFIINVPTNSNLPPFWLKADLFHWIIYLKFRQDNIVQQT
jgi:hypothetical protein